MDYRKTARILFAVFLTGIFLAGCGQTAGQEPEQALLETGLGINFRIPDSWEGRYVLVEAEDRLEFYAEKIYGEGNGGGLLTTVERQAGSLITAEELAREPVSMTIVLQEKGWTYVRTLPSDVQYPPDNKELADEYASLCSGLYELMAGAEIGKVELPAASEEGWYTEGSGFFTVELPLGWTVKKDNDLAWGVYDGEGNCLGDIRPIPYGSDTGFAGDAAACITDESLRRSLAVTFNTGDDEKENAVKVIQRTELRPGPYTIVDLQSDAAEYLVRGGKKVFGTIGNFVYSGDRLIGLEVEPMEFVTDTTGTDPNGFHIEDLPGGRQIMNLDLDYGPIIVPLSPPDYNSFGTYGFFPLDAEFVKEHKDIRDFYYEFILVGGKVFMVFARYIP